MRPIKSPTQFVSSLETRLKEATRGGKQVGAPTLQKALKGADASSLTPHQHEQLRDVFEKVKLTPKARELADRFVGSPQGHEKTLPKFFDGRVKAKADEPSLPGFDGPLTPPNIKAPEGLEKALPKFMDGRVKVKADEPSLPGFDGPLTPPNIKAPEGLEKALPKFFDGRVKVKMDEPSLPDIGGPFTPPNNGGLVKVKMDEPTLPDIGG
ncbi:hypothetical protein, partial [Myxococcus virescens]